MKSQLRQIYVIIVLISITCLLVLSSLADSQKSGDAEKTPKSGEGQIQKQEPPHSPDVNRDIEKQVSRKSELKKKVPAFWVLIPD